MIGRLRHGLLIIILLHSFNGFTQEFPSELWHEGKLVTIKEDTLIGQIKYDLKGDIVQVNINNTVKTFSSRKALYFEIFDETVDSYRYFYSLPYALQSNYEVPVLFEVLYEGKLTLLCREQIVTENSSPQNSYNYGYQPTTYTKTRLDYTYYFLNIKGNIIMYYLKKKELLSFFGKDSQSINQYMKKNKLKHDRKTDLVRIVAYYNAII